MGVSSTFIGNVPNPGDSSNLDADQRSVSFAVEYRNIDSIPMQFTLDLTYPNSGRNILFAAMT